MKKNLIVFVIMASAILMFSCHTASYHHDYESTPYRIDYRKGKWLLNEIESPQLIKSTLTQIAYDGFYEELGSDIQKADHLHTTISYVPIKPDKTLLERIKNETKVDYLINIKCRNSIDEIGGLQIGPVKK